MYLWIVLEHGAWRHFANEHTAKVYDYAEHEFEKFALAKRPAGLDVENGVAGLILICDQVGGKHAEKAKRLLREVIPAAADEHARPGNQNARKKAEAENAGDNVARVSHGSNSPNEILRRLKRDHKELAAKVVSRNVQKYDSGPE
jgi:hypothetical protein